MYTPEIPIIGDSLGGTRDRIRENFKLIKSVFGQNHWTFGQSHQGNHKFVVMPEVTASGSGVPGTNPNEAALYVEVGAAPFAEANLFMRAENNGQNYQLTRVIASAYNRFALNTVNYDPNNDGGWTFLPGGLILQYGKKKSVLTSNPGIVSFPIYFPNGLAPFSVVATSGSSVARAVGVFGLANNQFQYTITGGTQAVSDVLYWWAIGQ